MVAEPAGTDEATLALASDMLETMYAAQGRGLAAPQVGVLARVFVMDASWKTGTAQPETFLNPEILWRSDAVVPSTEGCLSIPGLLLEVPRAAEIILRWLMLDGTVAAQKLTGFRAICAQHEIDHLNGIVTLDHLSPEARAKAEAVLA
ncbi:peptide deformylase [bacterium]|nr:peptide deformylase [bacterium]